jgi:hypothetical protein
MAVSAVPSSKFQYAIVLPWLATDKMETSPITAILFMFFSFFQSPPQPRAAVRENDI